ncbi:MAG: hypothetical protein JJU18_13260 [Oceanicaulis sp.]|nr:hypothetical protein [Oceanicaulis sp.]
MPPATAEVIAFPRTGARASAGEAGGFSCQGDPASAVQAWLETQLRVIEYWRERLVAEGADWRMAAILDQHAAFLREACAL